MKKLTSRKVLFGSIFVLLVAALAHADDRIEYRKAEKAASTRGMIVEETVSGVKFKPAIGKEFFVPVADLIKIEYEVPARILDFGTITALDEKGEFAKALEGYKKLPAQMVTASDRAKRHVEYRIAMLKASLGEKDAAEALAEFLKKHPNSWQYSAAAKQLATLQMNKGLIDEAAKTIEALSRVEGLSKDLKEQAELLLIDIQFQAGKFDEVAKRIGGALATLPANDPQRPKLEIYKIGTSARDTPIAETVKKLEELIVNTEDRSLKALAYNTMGDCYLMKGLAKDAKFAYLWVDAVYNQDRSEHVKALERLAKLFESDPLKDEARAQFFHEKATRSR